MREPQLTYLMATDAAQRTDSVRIHVPKYICRQQVSSFPASAVPEG